MLLGFRSTPLLRGNFKLKAVKLSFGRVIIEGIVCDKYSFSIGFIVDQLNDFGLFLNLF